MDCVYIIRDETTEEAAEGRENGRGDSLFQELEA